MEERFTKAVIRIACLYASIWDRRSKNTMGDYISPIEGAKTFEAYVWGKDNGPTANS
jgi:hypothetical protein